MSGLCVSPGASVWVGAPPEVSGGVFPGVREREGGGVRGWPRPAVPGPAQLRAVRGAALHGGDRDQQSGGRGKTHCPCPVSEWYLLPITGTQLKSLSERWCKTGLNLQSRHND